MAGTNKPLEPAYSHWKVLSSSELNELVLDFEKFCSEGTMIINKEGRAVPFILNEAQTLLARTILPYAFKEIPEPVTVVVHKARQEGISVLLARLEQYISTRRKNINTVHLLPTDDLADKFYEQKARPLIEGTHPSLLAEIVATAKPTTFLRFRKFLGTVLNSYVKIGGALSKGASRSTTNHIIIFDEYAYYEKVTQLERGVLATQPKTGFALTVYVSTAKGVNHFYDVVKQARKKGSRMIYVFMPWHMLKEYEMEPQGRLKDLTSLTDYELKLCDIFEKEGYPVSSWARKLEFWQYVFETEAKNDWQYMFSEYPSTPEESFENTGNPVFPTGLLLSLYAKASAYWDETPPKNKDAVIDRGTSGVPRLIMRDVPLSPIKVYKEPEYGEKYLLGIDPAGGSLSGDYSDMVVLKESTMEEVCTFKDKIDQTELAEVAVNVARYYNNAIIIPERNMGSTLIEFIRLLGYGRMYVDPLSTQQRLMHGVQMTKASKDESIKRMRFLLINGIWKTNDKYFLDDAIHFVWQETPGGFKKAVASGTHEDTSEPYHDDSVLARLNIVATLDMRRWRLYVDKIELLRREGNK